jgi:hypothetical protein
MKRIVMLLSVVVLLLACSETEIEAYSYEEFKVEELAGNWSFHSLEYKGETYHECSHALNKEFSGLALSLLDVTDKTLMLYNACPNYFFSTKNVPFTVNDGILDIDNGYMVFKKIKSPTDPLKTMVLELVGSSNNLMPVGGIYTMTR